MKRTNLKVVGIAAAAVLALASWPGHEAARDLLRHADIAMYVAKETGRNRTALAGEPVRRRA